MLGFSFAELILVFIVALIFIKPQDLPELAKILAKFVHKIKKIYVEIKAGWQEILKQTEINDLQQQFQQQLKQEQQKDEKQTVIIDIYGKEHIITNVYDVRPDLTQQQIASEIENYNEQNKK